MRSVICRLAPWNPCHSRPGDWQLKRQRATSAAARRRLFFINWSSSTTRRPGGSGTGRPQPAHLRAAGVRSLPEVRPARTRLPPGPLHPVPRGGAGGLQPQAPWFLLELRRPAHGGDGGAAGVDERKKVERLCRYIARPPIATGRLSLTTQGQVRYALKTPYRAGTTHVVFEPLDFLARLSPLVTPAGRVRTVRTRPLSLADHRQLTCHSSELAVRPADANGQGASYTALALTLPAPWVGHHKAGLTWFDGRCTDPSKTVETHSLDVSDTCLWKPPRTVRCVKRR